MEKTPPPASEPVSTPTERIHYDPRGAVNFTHKYSEVRARFKRHVMAHRLYHYVFLGAIVLYITAGTQAKLAGVAGFMALLGCVILYCVLARAFYFYLSLFLFTVLGVVYIILSYGELLPPAWTILYDQSQIMRQGFFVISFYPLIVGAQRFWIHAILSNRMGIYAFGMIIAFFGIRSLHETILFPQKAGDALISLKFYGLINQETMILFALYYLIIIQFRHHRFFLLAIFAPLTLLLANTAQIMIVAPMMVAFAILPNRLMPVFLAITVLTLCVVAIVLMFYIEEIFIIDPNTGLRQLYWRDSILGVYQTNGLGIGFGREVTSRYLPEFFREGELAFTDHMNDNIHNSYLSMFFRMGIGGGVLFLIFIFGTCFPRAFQNPAVTAHACFAFFLAFLSMFVNTGMESPRVIVGISLCLGYILACKELQFAPRRPLLIRRFLPPAKRIMAAHAYSEKYRSESNPYKPFP